MPCLFCLAQYGVCLGTTGFHVGRPDNLTSPCYMELETAVPVWELQMIAPTKPGL